jgi:hypothetical protein
MRKKILPPPVSGAFIICRLCKMKFDGRTAKRDCKRHLKICERKAMVMENDSEIFGIKWKNINTNEFKCMHCSENQPPYNPKNCRPYTTKLREHAFRHIFKMHSNEIHSDAVKINIKCKTPNKAQLRTDIDVLTDTNIAASHDNVLGVENLKGK